MKILSTISTIAILCFYAPLTIESADTTVYIVATGKVYHSTKNCRGLKNTKHKILEVSLKEAKKTRRPCKICY